MPMFGEVEEPTIAGGWSSMGPVDQEMGDYFRGL